LRITRRNSLNSHDLLDAPFGSNMHVLRLCAPHNTLNLVVLRSPLVRQSDTASWLHPLLIQPHLLPS
jgi:hypothetical protein